MTLRRFRMGPRALKYDVDLLLPPPASLKGGRTRADKIGVGAGGDIGGTDISCIFMARQYTGPTRQSYWDDHRHVGVMPATPSINTPARCAEQVRTRLPCDVRCFVVSLVKTGACSLCSGLRDEEPNDPQCIQM
jgi:hypothetical protein